MGLGGAILGAILGSMLGPWGALIGAGIGATWGGKGSPEKGDSGDNPALYWLFRSLGKLAKSDGLVSQEEAEVVSSLLRSLGLPSGLRQRLRQAFNEGKLPGTPLEDSLRQVAIHFPGRNYPEVLGIYATVATADGRISGAEWEFLHAAEKIFERPGFFDAYFRSDRRQSAAAAGASDPYRVLGVSPDAGDEEIKRAWRSKVQSLHPDKLQGQGVSPQVLEMANAEVQKINAAYAEIRRRRKSA